MRTKKICTVLFFITFLFSSSAVYAQDRNVTIKLYQTTDVHGNFFPFDFINNVPGKGSFARVSTYMKEQRKAFADNVLLFDSGDLLQGQPAVYYANFVDTVSPHLCALTINYIGYDAATIGNHDIEAGHAVYDRWIKDCSFPVLGANVLTTAGHPYLPPYQMFVKDGVKIAVVGMITPAIPAWLPEVLWKGLYFEDIEKSARELIPYIKQKENPDVIVGLLHSGVKTSFIAGYKESAAMEVAQQVPGFDIVFCGHDHTPFNQKVANVDGDSVLVINPGPGAKMISDVTLQVQFKNGKVAKKSVNGVLRNIGSIEPDEAYMQHFASAYDQTKDYVNAKIGVFQNPISVRDAWFGSSAFVDLLHGIQLKVTGADISLVAPLDQNTTIDAGDVYVRDMFKIYRFENMLYTMSLTGAEIKNALEYSYGLWTNQMTTPNDHLLLIEPIANSNKYRFKNLFLSFDSAAGIKYTVDVTKPIGEKIEILSMANGQPFAADHNYRVAVNSYQGSGGGEILTVGAGIERSQLDERIVSSTEKDLRYYLIEEIKQQKVLSPQPLNQWHFVPEQWTDAAKKRDYVLLFGK